MMLILTYTNDNSTLRTVLTYCWVVFINKTENNTIIISKFTHFKTYFLQVFYDLQMSKHCHNIHDTNEN